MRGDAALIQELLAEGVCTVTRYRPQADKVMLIHAQTAMIENRFVHLPQEAPWLGEYLHELAVFPYTAASTTRSTRRRSCSTGSNRPREDGIPAV
jgi:phage terminase large subunit-like protein